MDEDIEIFSRYINHVIAKEIVKKTKEYQACIVLEKLRGVKRKTAKTPKWVRKLLHVINWNVKEMVVDKQT